MIADILEDIRERGWKVNNLFELDDGGWQANLRKEDWFTEFGQGETAEDALLRAIDKLSTAERSERKEKGPTAIAAPTRGINLVEALGIRRQPLRRI